MGDFFSCFQHSRSSQADRRKLPEMKEDAEDETVPAAPPPPPPPAAAAATAAATQPLALLTPLPCAPEAEPPATTPLPPTLEALQRQLEALKELQGQYIQGQLKVRRTCQHFPRSLRALSLQICRTRRRLIRTEVRLQRSEKEGHPTRLVAIQAPGSGASDGLLAVVASPSRPLLLSASASGEIASVAPTLSSYSLPLHPLPPPPPSPPPLQPDQGGLREALETFVELQAHHLQDRKRDFRNCQECLKSIKALRGQLRKVRSRLWRVEAQLGIQVPPRELDVNEQEEEEEDP